MQEQRFQDVELSRTPQQQQVGNWYESSAGHSARNLYDSGKPEQDQSAGTTNGNRPAFITSPTSETEYDNEHLNHKTVPFRPSLDNVTLPQNPVQPPKKSTEFTNSKLTGKLVSISGGILFLLVAVSFVGSLISNITSTANATGFGIALAIVILLVDVCMHFGLWTASVVGIVAGLRAQVKERHQLGRVYFACLILAIVAYSIIIVGRWIPQLYNFITVDTGAGSFVVSIILALATFCISYTVFGLFIFVSWIFVSTAKAELRQEEELAGHELAEP